MKTRLLTAAASLTVSQVALAGTDIYFNPLTQSGVVSASNSAVEMNSPWLVPPGLSQVNLTSLDEIEKDVVQSVVRVPGTGTQASMIDMLAFDDEGENIFMPHETPFGAGVTRYNLANDFAETLFRGDQGGAAGNWANDYGAFDPATFTPNRTVFLGEEWAGEGRIIEVLNPHAPVAAIQKRELTSIINVSHEGLRFSHDGGTLYFIDEDNSGCIYKFVSATLGDYTRGQTFALAVDDFAGDPAATYSATANATAVRVGAATWVPMTDANGSPLTTTDPFSNSGGPEARAGRLACDEVRGTPFGRPEDAEVGELANGHQVFYFTATSEQAVYSVEMLGSGTAIVRQAAKEGVTPKNLGFPGTSGVLNSPDNLAQDALGNIYIIEDAPNASAEGGDVWFMRDADNDGVAESLDHFMTIQVAGSEATGMIFNPVKPTQFVLAVQHPSSADLGVVPSGFGDAVWSFDLKDIVAPPCKAGGAGPWWRGGGRDAKVCSKDQGAFVRALEKAGRRR
jgi:uncharacterized protein